MATESKDVITFKQKPVLIIRDEETLEVFSDENLSLVLKFLIKGPLSIEDLEKNFKRYGEEKSDKSIYRYLNKLIEKKLVAKAGKRITSKNADDLTSETIYSRTAIAFITVAPVDKHVDAKEGEYGEVWIATKLLLEEFFGKKADSNEFLEFATKLDEEKDDLVIKLFENASDETLERVAKLNYMGVNFVLQFVGWLASISQSDLRTEITSLFK